MVLNEDVNYYAVEAKKGQRLSVEVEGLRLGESFFDPSVAIMDTNRFVLAAADDTPLLRQDCACSVIVPRDGTYVIQVRESAFGGSDRCHYRLHVGTFPRPLAVYPAGGKFGQTVDVTYIGAAGGPITQKLALPAGPQPGFAAWAQDGQGMAPSPNPFRLSPLENVLEKEPNNDAQHATPFTAPAALNGVIDPPGDTDCWVFPAKKGQTFDVRVFARQLRTPLDSTLSISAHQGPVHRLQRRQQWAGQLYPLHRARGRSVRDQRHRPDGPRRAGFRLPRGSHAGRAAVDGRPARANDSTSTWSPRCRKGTGCAVMVGCQREDFGGDVTLELQNLPEKVSPQMLPIVADQNAAPLLLSAPADAEPRKRPWWSRRSAQGRQPHDRGPVAQKTMLVRGDNNREVWSYVGNRMAVAVTEPVPFHIEIVPPKVPLVQNGNMELKVAAARDGGFKGPICSSHALQPAGRLVARFVTIPEGQ